MEYLHNPEFMDPAEGALLKRGEHFKESAAKVKEIMRRNYIENRIVCEILEASSSWWKDALLKGDYVARFRMSSKMPEYFQADTNTYGEIVKSLIPDFAKRGYVIEVGGSSGDLVSIKVIVSAQVKEALMKHLDAFNYCGSGKEIGVYMIKKLKESL